MLQLWARLDQGAMAMKGCSAFPKAPALLESFSVISRILVRGVLSLCRDSVGVFNRPKRLNWVGFVSYLGPSLGGSYPPEEMQLVYTTAPTDWIVMVWYTGQSLAVLPAPTWRDAVGVFYSSSQMGCDGLVSYPGYSLVGSYPSAEMQSVYSTALANCARIKYDLCSILHISCSCWCYILIYRFIYTYICWIHTIAIITDEQRLL